MFIFDEDYTFEWPVRVAMPAGGSAVEAEFTARFRMVEEDELFARRGGGEGAPPEIGMLIAGERETLAKRLVGWSGITTPDGAELPFSPEARDRLLRQRGVREALTAAYFDAVLRGEVAEKN